MHFCNYWVLPTPTGWEFSKCILEAFIGQELFGNWDFSQSILNAFNPSEFSSRFYLDNFTDPVCFFVFDNFR